MHKLISSSDVLVQNSRPGTMERLGFGEPALRELNPPLIYVSISGVGESGPYAKKHIYDPIIQGLSGFAFQADPRTRPAADDPHRRTRLQLSCGSAITASLFARERTGEGQHIRLAMLGAQSDHLSLAGGDDPVHRG